MIRLQIPRIVLVITAMFVFAILVNAEVPSVINYQGRLTNPDGTPVEDNDYQIKFIIYGSESDPDSLWSSGFHDVAVTNGLFSYLLGSNVTLPDSIFNSQNLYLGIAVESDPEISRRTQLTSSAFAFKAQVSDTSDYAKNIADLSVTQDKIANNAINTYHIQDGSIDLVDLGSGGAANGETIIWNNSVMEWKPGAVGTGDITSVTPGSGLTGGGTSGDITLSVGAGAIIASHMATSSVQSDAIAPNAVGASEIDNNAVGASEIADGVIYATHIADNAVTQSKIAQNAVTNYELADNAVDFREIVTGAVRSDEIADGVIYATHIADDAVGASEIATDAVNYPEIVSGAVRSDEILDGTILDEDISSSANIGVDKISGTAVNLNLTQTIAGEKTFDGMVHIGDSTMKIDNEGIVIGTDFYDPNDQTLIRIKRTYNEPVLQFGIQSELDNSGDGLLIGISNIIRQTSSTGNCIGMNSYVYSNLTSRTGLNIIAQSNDTPYGLGYSYGINCSADDGDVNYALYAYAGEGTNGQYGIYAKVDGPEPYNNDYAGYFRGNVNITGLVNKSIGGYKIDHPDDPENMYLMHSDVSSPEMKNIYDGTVTLDANGESVIELPTYFESLNEDFRYQLTPIGGAMAELHVAEEIIDNRFRIAGGKPYMKVSWQVTGIRKDLISKAVPIGVETYKDDDERGLYIIPEVYGYGIEKSVDYKHVKRAEESQRNLE